jgi:hypothetical protein
MGEMTEAEWKDFFESGSDGSPPGCHADLETVCGTCKTFPKEWPAHNWNCRTRGAPVSKHTHACAKYREDEEFAAIFSEAAYRHATPKERIESINLPESPHWFYRRAEKAAALQIQPPVAPGPPQEDLRKHIGGVVYFIDCQQYTKIGFTSQPIEDRLKGIEGANPFPIALWALVKGPVALERRFLGKFNSRRHRLEWFELKLGDRAVIKRLVTLLGGEVYHLKDGRHA